MIVRSSYSKLISRKTKIRLRKQIKRFWGAFMRNPFTKSIGQFEFTQNIGIEIQRILEMSQHEIFLAAVVNKNNHCAIFQVEKHLMTTVVHGADSLNSCYGKTMETYVMSQVHQTFEGAKFYVSSYAYKSTSNGGICSKAVSCWTS